MDEARRRAQGGSTNAKLSHHLRLTVYSYLPLKTLLTKIALQNCYEKRLLHNSAIARKNKSFQLILRKDRWYEILEQSGQVPRPMLHQICNMVSELEIEIDSDANSLRKDTYHNIRNLILNLPPWLDDGRLTLVIFYSNRLKMINLDEMCRVFAKEKPNLRFKSFELIGPEEAEDKQHPHYSYALNYLIQHSEKISLSNTYIDLQNHKTADLDCPLKRLVLY